MEAEAFFRVVALRKGKFKSVEFRLREGEKGLSLFAALPGFRPAVLLEAVRDIGKRGDLAVAAIRGEDLRRLGLKLISTPGGTAVAEINAAHCEARISFFRKLWLMLIRKSVQEYFNERFSEPLCAAAQLLD
jgi:hypothetical protein